MTRTERQNLVIENWKKFKCKGSVVAATGFGKTRTAIIAIQRVLHKNPTVKVVIVVPTKILKEQWEQLLIQNSIVAEVLVINTAANKPFKCDMLVIDEIHKAAADFMKTLFTNCSPHFILGLTATYERLDGKEKIIDQYAPVCDTITIDEALLNGWLSPYREYKVLLDVDLTEYNKANETFLKSFSFFNFDFDMAMNIASNKKLQQQYAKAINQELKIVQANAYTFIRSLQFRKKFILNHPKKLEIATKILTSRVNQKCITFNGSINFCKKYGFGYVLHSKQKDSENKKILTAFTQSITGVLHTSKMVNEGLDCPGLQVAIITGFNSSKTTKVQQIGRIIRKEEGKVAEIFTLILKDTVEEKWFAKAEENLNFIEITESELDLVLQNKPINKVAQTQEKTNSFRF